MPTALELGGKKPTRKKKRKNSFDFIHIQTWWEKKDQFVSLTLAATMALRCNATVSLQAACLSTDDGAISLSVHPLQCHSHIPKTSLLPDNAILPQGGDAQSGTGNSQCGEWDFAHKVPADSAVIRAGSLRALLRRTLWQGQEQSGMDKVRTTKQATQWECCMLPPARTGETGSSSKEMGYVK